MGWHTPAHFCIDRIDIIADKIYYPCIPIIVTMKTKLILFVLCLCPLLSLAQGSITIYSEDTDKFTLSISGAPQNNTPGAYVKVDGLTDKIYTVKVSFNDISKPNVESTVNITDPDDGRLANVTYKLTSVNGRIVLKYVSVTKNDPLAGGNTIHYVPAFTDTRPATESSTITNERANEAPPVSNQLCSHAIDRTLFQEAVSKISAAAYEEEKLSLAVTLVTNNCLTTEQVKSVCQLMKYEISKLSFAKAAYTKTIDQDNYLEVGDVFLSESSKQELKNFIGPRGRYYRK